MAFFANHLVNIPVSLFLGLGKYIAFFIALAMDLVQITIYYNVLNNTTLGKRFHLSIDHELYEAYKKPKIIEKLHNSWLYIGVFALSFLPIYFGGLFASVFTAHLLRLNKTKSMICVVIGSLFGCYVWTIGVWSIFEVAIRYIKHLF